MSLRNSRGVAVSLVTLSVFTDVLAYSIAVPVLPHLSRQFGASPTVIGLLFASFGITLLAVSVPMGSISDRVGRRLPLQQFPLRQGFDFFFKQPSAETGRPIRQKHLIVEIRGIVGNEIHWPSMRDSADANAIANSTATPRNAHARRNRFMIITNDA